MATNAGPSSSRPSRSGSATPTFLERRSRDLEEYDEEGDVDGAKRALLSNEEQVEDLDEEMGVEMGIKSVDVSRTSSRTWKGKRQTNIQFVKEMLVEVCLFSLRYVTWGM